MAKWRMCRAMCSRRPKCWSITVSVFIVLGAGWYGPGQAQEEMARIGLGRVPSEAEIAAWDVAIGPAGTELPAGQGTAIEGASIFLEKCAACHGENGHEGPDDVLVGGHGSLATASPLQTVGSFWPYATTVYDYVARAMPFWEPGSLRSDEVYALTAFLLHLNGIVAKDYVLDARRLPQIQMPNRNGFRPGPEAKRFGVAKETTPRQ